MSVDILFVCTGNTCRSPMAEVLLGHHLRERGMADARVHSAGTLQWRGPANPAACTVVAERGLDLGTHESRMLTVDMVAAADLVLAMTRDHVGGVLAHDAGARHRTFLLGEVVRLGRHVGPRRDADVRTWIAAVDAARPPGRPHGRAADEIADPVGHPVEVYRRTADRLDRLTAELGDLLAGRGPGHAHGESPRP